MQMHPYDFPATTQIISGNKADYYSQIDKNYFDICAGAKVLEIAPHAGNHTKLIAKHVPLYLECVEGDAIHQSIIKNIPGVDKVVVEDIWLRVDNTPFDIVICFGLLYHHHSALHLLELLVNYHSPKYIMLDCLTAEHPLAYLPESVNVSGFRQIRPHWKHCGVNLKPPFFIVNMSMANMGYELKKTHKLQTSYFPKSNGWVALWERKEKL
jgi:hypothetical protein